MNFKYSVVILCGGKSSRMGENKALLKYEDSDMITTIYNNFKQCDEVFVSVGKNDIYNNVGGIHIFDDYDDCGPLSGIDKALKLMKNEWLFVVGCDMPLITKEISDYMFSLINDNSDAIVSLSQNKINSIGAFYNKRIANNISMMLKSNNFKMLDLLRQINTKYFLLEIENEKYFANINTKKDYKKVLKKQIPVLCVSGYSGSGKTTICLKIINFLNNKGIRVSYIKHTHHILELNDNKDSNKIINENVSSSIVFNDFSHIKYEKKDTSIVELISSIEDVDLIIVEGMKNSSIPKLWIKSKKDDVKELENRNDIIYFVEQNVDYNKLYKFVLEYIAR